MKQAFIIMQIGNPDLDNVYHQAIVPAVVSTGLDPKRVDKHNQGELLKSEIISFIKNSDIIVADLTNERPNCYLEIGYTMGMGKFKNLILTAREDHLAESPNHKANGPKIHFDLIGYDILFWHPDKLDEFKAELAKRVQRRLQLVDKAVEKTSVWDDEWILKNREKAKKGLATIGLSTYFELRFALTEEKKDIPVKELLIATDNSQIHTFGWPLGIVMPNDGYRPKPKSNGIEAEILINNRTEKNRAENSYDYWALKKNGDFFLLASIFEDLSDRSIGKLIFFDTRIIRVTEALLYCSKLYKNLGVRPESYVSFNIRHVGIYGRMLGASSSNRRLYQSPKCSEDEFESSSHFQIAQVETELISLVKQHIEPFFSLFDFFALNDSVYSDIVMKYKDGKIP